MWDTRSIIVRFRRQRGNTCLPGEPKPNVKKVKEEPNSSSSNSSQVNKEQKAIRGDKSVTKLETDVENRLQDNSNKVQNKPSSQAQEQSANLQSSSSPTATSIASVKSGQQQQQQPWVQMSKESKLFFKQPSNEYRKFEMEYFCVRPANHRKYLPHQKLHHLARLRANQLQKRLCSPRLKKSRKITKRWTCRVIFDLMMI